MGIEDFTASNDATTEVTLEDIQRAMERVGASFKPEWDAIVMTEAKLRELCRLMPPGHCIKPSVARRMVFAGLPLFIEPTCERARATSIELVNRGKRVMEVV